MKKEIEAFVNAANEQELEAAWNNLSAEEQRIFEQLMEEDSPEDALAFFAQLVHTGNWFLFQCHYFISSSFRSRTCLLISIISSICGPWTTL